MSQTWPFPSGMWDGNMLLLNSKCRRETTIMHFSSLWISIYDSLNARNKIETECAWLKRTQLKFGKSSDSINCKSLLYNIFSNFSLLEVDWPSYSEASNKKLCFCSNTFSSLLLPQLHHLLFGIWCWFDIQCCQNPEFYTVFSKAMLFLPERSITGLTADLIAKARRSQVQQLCWWGPIASAKAIFALIKTVTMFSEGKWHGELFSRVFSWETLSRNASTFFLLHFSFTITKSKAQQYQHAMSPHQE